MSEMSAEFVPNSNWVHSRQHFYKYTSRQAAKKILESQTLQWSSPKLLNDPYDLQIDLQFDVDFALAKKLTLRKLWDAFDGDLDWEPQNPLGVLLQDLKGKLSITRQEFETEFANTFEESVRGMMGYFPELVTKLRAGFDKSKVLCLSEDPMNIPMWSYYAEGHQGVVLELRCVPEVDSVWGAAQPVRYRENLPTIFDEEGLSDILSGRGMIDHKTRMDEMALTKAKSWSHEKEWRIIDHSNEDEITPFSYYGYSKAELSMVILGCRMPQEDQENLRAIVTSMYPDTRVCSASPLPNEFNLIIQ